MTTRPCRFTYSFNAPITYTIIPFLMLSGMSLAYIAAKLRAVSPHWFINLPLMSLNVIGWLISSLYVLTEPFKNAWLQWIAFFCLISPFFVYLAVRKPFPHYIPFIRQHLWIFIDGGVNWHIPELDDDPLDPILVNILFLRVGRGLVRAGKVVANIVLLLLIPVCVIVGSVLASLVLLLVECSFFICGCFSITSAGTLFKGFWSLEVRDNEEPELSQTNFNIALMTRLYLQAIPLLVVYTLNSIGTSHRSAVSVVHLVVSITMFVVFGFRGLVQFPCQGFKKHVSLYFDDN